MTNFLIIDTSYYNFYRYHATLQWYKNAFPEENCDEILDWSVNSVFMEKFEKMFLENINKYKKKFSINQIILARDCKRSNIWRCNFYSDYKKNRDMLYSHPNKFKGGPVFKYCYENIIPKILNSYTQQIMIDQLEGDDIIYLCSQKIKVNNKIYIISSDHDLLQILDNKNDIYLYTANLVCYNQKSKGNCDLNNFIKAMLGDSSDNIKKILPRLGEKTALKLYDNKKELLNKFLENPDSFKNYCLNRLLVDFKYIPYELSNYFNNNIKL